MPLIINQMPSGAIQYPQMGPNRSDLYAMQAAAFMNQPSQNKEADLASLLALVQFLSQGKQLNLERELRTADLGLRREELRNMLEESRANREFQREDNALARALQGQFQKDSLGLQRETLGETTAARQEANQLLKTLYSNQNTLAEKQLGISETLANIQKTAAEASSEFTGAQTEALQETVRQGREMQAQAQRLEAAQGISRMSEAQAVGELGAADTESEQLLAEAQSGFARGSRKFMDLMDPRMTPVLNALSEGKTLGKDETQILGAGILNMAQSASNAALQESDPHARAAILAQARNRISAVRSQAIPDRFGGPLGDLVDLRKPMFGTTKQAWIVNMADEAEKMLGMAADEIGGVKYTSAQTPEEYAASLRPEIIKKQGAAKQRIAQMSAQRQGQLAGVMAGKGTPEDIYAIMAPGSRPALNNAPVPIASPAPPTVRVAAPATQPYWDPFGPNPNDF